MPRGVRKASVNPQKSQLRFVEQPMTGARHDYGVQIRSAINPRSFVSEESRRDITESSWVSPQFTSFEASQSRRYRRGRKNNQIHTRTLNGAPLSTLPHVGRATVCKYPALLFDTSQSVPLRSRRNLCETRTSSCAGDPQRDSEITSAGKHNGLPGQTPKTRRCQTISADPGCSELLRTPSGSTHQEQRNSQDAGPPKGSFTPDSILSPPHIETPNMPSCDDSPSSSILRLLFSPSQNQTPPRTKNPLVKDTPERDYGLKVTWRRRKDLMKLLTEQGRMLVSEAMVTL